NEFGFFGQCFRCKRTFGWRPGNPTSEAVETAARSQSQRREKRSRLDPKWRQFWDACLPITETCVVGRYLAGRDCPLNAHDLRWKPSHWHRAAKREFPCMVALITDYRTCEPVSLHFTWLAHDGSSKALVDRPRLYLEGHISRGIVRLCPDDTVAQGLIIGEGIETCLTAMLEFNAVWSCLDAGGIAAFPLLPGLEGLTVLIDNDNAGRDAFATVRARYEAA